MGYVFDFNDALAYERWVRSPGAQQTIRLEKRLMTGMLKPIRGETLLDIGCGTGESITPFLDLGLEVTGVDASPYMLDATLKNLGNRVRSLIEHSYIIHHNKKLHVTISLGATLVKDEDTIESLFKRADDLLYQSKANGRNRLTTD